jgi:hypothetical protein
MTMLGENTHTFPITIMNHLAYCIAKMSLGISAFFFYLTPNALAGRFGSIPAINGLANGSGVSGLKNAIANFLNDALNLLGIIAVAVIIIAGVRMVISLGNETAVEGAKKTILYALVGLVIVILAKVIVNWILNLNW